ncbi:MAG: bifunctional methylenetetrahydrofolate dehydrogenase/methenyltetrahydrofolate cyclohydrolase FolD [Spirochaetaceae bacterium]|nr:MAG: bifunctional methylenetetrahydrofolate dehydrogenase/methenyltetrahydrofolate cyclohydrolase FolD [Spirochaetaceae bacterium]
MVQETVHLLDGNSISERLRTDIGAAVLRLKNTGIVPGLATVLVGDNPASASYIRSKQRACADLGINPVDVTLPADIAQSALLDELAALNERPDVHGVLVQQPLPRHIDVEAVVEAVSPEKDVDGFHPVNLGRMVRGRRCFLPCTPFGVQKILEFAGISVAGRHVVIVGRSLLVGKPLATMLLEKSSTANATVTVCHSGTRELGEITRSADILVAAIGQPGFISADMVCDGAVVVDVGINRVDDSSRKRGYRIVGDVDFAAVSERCSAITPVPGGVGPMTVTMLLYNTVQSARGMRSQDALGDDA